MNTKVGEPSNSMRVDIPKDKVTVRGADDSAVAEESRV
jgi:hypothetical protein